MIPSHLKALKRQLASPKSIVIVTHWSPDGDAMGSSLGLGLFLKKMGHRVTVVTPNDYPEFLHWLPGNKQVVNAQLDPRKAERSIAKSEFIFCLDFNDLKRINILGKQIETQEVTKILIDHHPQPDDFADYTLHDVKASSTAELIYTFITVLGGEKKVDRNIANCLYVGIMTDTGSFRFPSTSAYTHEVIQKLIEAGAENAANHNRIYDDNSENRIRLLGYTLSNKLVVLPECRTAYFTLSYEEHERFQYRKGDTEGLVNYALTIKGIVFAAFFAERDGLVKCSFRSKGKFDVNSFARSHFNGGGHKNAAGGASGSGLKETEKKFVHLVKENLPQLLKA